MRIEFPILFPFPFPFPFPPLNMFCIQHDATSCAVCMYVYRVYGAVALSSLLQSPRPWQFLQFLQTSGVRLVAGSSAGF